MGRVKVQEVSSGDICALVGIEGFEIGDTVCDYENRIEIGDFNAAPATILKKPYWN